MNRIIKILKDIHIPFAYHHFAEGESPKPPFICYLTTGSDNFSADGVVYHKQNVYHLELYTDFKGPETENRIEKLLDENEIYYEKQETYIESEKLYEVVYIFES